MVLVLATGGTISGRSSDTTDVRNYEFGVMSGADLLSSVPEVSEIAEVEVSEVASIGSHEITPVMWLRLARLAGEGLERPEVSGLVISHGTDTLVETAFFLESTLGSHKPVVLTGAMRPGSAVSADGPMNLVQATAVAVHPQAQDRGVLIAMNDRIVSAYYAQKSSTTALQSFDTSDQGFIGGFVGKEPFFYFTAGRPVERSYFDILRVSELPIVEIVTTYQGCDQSQLNLAVSRSDGVVVSAPGSGWPPPLIEARIRDLVAAGYPVVIVGTAGMSLRDQGLGRSAGLLDASKARIELMLWLASR